MTGNSTLLIIIDSSEGEDEIQNIDEILDPCGKCSIELEKTFKFIDLSPREELISNILMEV